MIRRIAPLVMVLTIALCPVALDVCQVACAEHEQRTVAMLTSAAHHHHAEPADATIAHHDGHRAAPETAATATASAATMRGGPDGCLHGEGLPAFVGTNLQIALTPVGAVPTLLPVPPLASGPLLAVDTGSVVHSPPITLTTQLRV